MKQNTFMYSSFNLLYRFIWFNLFKIEENQLTARKKPRAHVTPD